MPIRLGLAANRIHHQTEDAALFGWLRACESGIRELQLGLHAVGRTFDAIQAAGMLASYRGLRRYPYGREGGLMKLVAEVVGVEGDERTIDGAIYLTDPVDPSSIFPEAVALKRQCVIHGKPFLSTVADALALERHGVIHGKPFLSTVASARDWIEMERIHAGLPRDAGAQRFHDYAQQTLARPRWTGRACRG